MGVVPASSPVGGFADRGPEASGARASLWRSLLGRMGALGSALMIERGAGFLANVLAARLAGAEVFGAYSLALTTANNVASYAGAGIGVTANRFVGEYPPGTRGHRRLLRTLAFVALVSAVLAAILLYLGAGPLARELLKNEKLIFPLRVGAWSAGAIVLLECCRGLLIGQRSYVLLLVLSALSGCGILLLVPLAAAFGSEAMLSAQAGAVLTAALIPAFLVWRKAPSCKQAMSPQPINRRPSVWMIWRFGLTQLSGMIGVNLAVWWIASLVTRGDPSLVQMAFYAVSSQFRNLAALTPGLVWQSSFALLTHEGGQEFGGAQRVLVTSTYISATLALTAVSLAIALIPVLIARIYGEAYRGAELAASLAVLTALLHMTASPAASRLAVISLPWTGSINLIWAVVVFAGGWVFYPTMGASMATGILLGAHAVSLVLVLAALYRLEGMPREVLSVSLFTGLSTAVFLGLLLLRARQAIGPDAAVAANAVVGFLSLIGLVWLGRFFRIVPRGGWQQLLQYLKGIQPNRTAMGS